VAFGYPPPAMTRASRPPRLRAPWALALPGALAWAASADAQPAPVLAIDCPELGAEPRSALESRARADLMVRRESGTLVVVCSPGVARLSWHPLRGASVESTASLPSDPRIAVDGLLEAIDALLGPSEPIMGPPEPVLPDTSNAPMAGASTVPGGPRAADPAPASGVVAAAPPAPAPVGVGVAAGASLELWSQAVIGTLGPEARVQLVVPRGLALTAGGGVSWTLASSMGVSARVIRLLAGAEYAVDDAGRVRVGANAFADGLRAIPDPSLQTAATTRTTFGVGLRASYAFISSQPFQLLVGPTLSLRPSPVRVNLDANEVFRVPVLAVGLTAELAFGPL
jgi:hypothetical protein